MSKCAIYARFSSDLQRDQSIDDQLHLCRAHAARMGWKVVAEHHDRARSGASLIGRPGVLALLGAAAQGGFEIILAESPDRLSRDLADLATIRKTLAAQGVEIHSVNGGAGPLDVIQTGMRGILGELFLQDLKAKTRRGMAGVIREGRHNGGRPYGYRPVPGQPGRLEIVPEQADVIRRVWTMYAEGETPRDIAKALNAERVPAPRGGVWVANTINGNAGRGGGILRNSIYEGRIEWGRLRMVLDPRTGRRVSRKNPAGEVQVAEAPELRIVEKTLAERVHARREERANKATGPRETTRKKRLLSGVLKCGICGGPLAAFGTTRGVTYIRCTRATEAGVCGSTKRFRLDTIERTVLTALMQHFADPNLLREKMEVFLAERKAEIDAARKERARYEKRLGTARLAIERIVDHLAEGLIDKEEARSKLERLRAERDEAERALASASETAGAVELHPATLRRYFLDVQEFKAMIETGVTDRRDEKIEAIRRLVGEVVVTPTAPYQPPLVEVKGRVAAMLERPFMPGATTYVADPGQAGNVVVSPENLVAGGRVGRESIIVRGLFTAQAQPVKSL